MNDPTKIQGWLLKKKSKGFLRGENLRWFKIEKVEVKSLLKLLKICKY